MSVHLKNVHEGKKYICTYCNDIFATKACVVRHIQGQHKQHANPTAQIETRNYLTDERNNAMSDADIDKKIEECEKKIEDQKRIIEALAVEIAVTQNEPEDELKPKKKPRQKKQNK